MINKRPIKGIRQIIDTARLRDVLMLLIWFCIAISVMYAQNPSMSYGEQFLQVADQECMRRVPVAYQAAGFFPGTPSVNTTYATKGIHSAYIRCLGEPEKSRTRVIIVIGSNSRDENVPGAERVKLQELMNQTDRAVREFSPTAVINYKSWDGLKWAAKLQGDGFLHAPIGDWTRAHADSIINYIAWDGQRWTAKIQGNVFLHAPNGDWARAHTDTIINYFSWENVKMTARLR
jgi:hypothetical protein